MNDFLTLNPIKYINGTCNLPGSKSISNRALLLSAQAKGITHLTNLLDSEDVRYMLKALAKLGVKYYLSPNRRNCKIYGLGKPLCTKAKLTLFIGNAGTVMRFLTAALCIKKQNIILTGDSRMKKRPIAHLVTAIQQGGAQVEYLEYKNYPPLCLYGGYLGGDIIINGSVSSQFVTALLMMAPLAQYPTYIHIKGSVVSKPYIDMTISLMKIFGIEVKHNDYQFFYFPGRGMYKSPGKYLVEGDASSASYFLAAAAIRGGTVRVTGIDRYSIQGDIQFANVLENMGANISWGHNYIECSRATLNAIDIDINHIPDAGMIVAIIALFIHNGITTLRNIANWRVKETDRLTAMATELRKIGAIVIEGEDYLVIMPTNKINCTSINTYNDHRIAMCFALIALSNVPVTILNPQCINKTFPSFFDELAALSIM